MAHHLILLMTALLPAATGTDGADQLAAPVQLTADGAAIHTNDYTGHSGPLVADYDGDGLADLLVGSFRGHIQLFKNVGTKEAPTFKAEGLLKADGEIVKIKNW